MPLELPPTPRGSRDAALHHLGALAGGAGARRLAEGAAPRALSDGIGVVDVVSAELGPALLGAPAPAVWWHVVLEGATPVAVVETGSPGPGSALGVRALDQGGLAEHLLAALRVAERLGLADRRTVTVLRVPDLGLLLLRLQPAAGGLDVYVPLTPGLAALAAERPATRSQVAAAVADARRRRPTPEGLAEGGGPGAGHTGPRAPTTDPGAPHG
jgi:hypothetical protein